MLYNDKKRMHKGQFHLSCQIYRTIQVESDITFFKLPHIIQIAMGWWNYHLYQFDANSLCIANPVFVDYRDVLLEKQKKTV